MGAANCCWPRLEPKDRWKLNCVSEFPEVCNNKLASYQHQTLADFSLFVAKTQKQTFTILYRARMLLLDLIWVFARIGQYWRTYMDIGLDCGTSWPSAQVECAYVCTIHNFWLEFWSPPHVCSVHRDVEETCDQSRVTFCVSLQLELLQTQPIQVPHHNPKHTKKNYQPKVEKSNFTKHQEQVEDRLCVTPRGG